MKQIYSATGCASAIEYLGDIANGRRPKPKDAELEILNEQARQIVRVLRGPDLAQLLDELMKRAAP